MDGSADKADIKRNLAWAAEKKRLISKTNYIHFRFSFGNHPNKSQSKHFKQTVGIFLFSMSSYFHLSAADIQVQTPSGWMTTLHIVTPQMIMFTWSEPVGFSVCGVP